MQTLSPLRYILKQWLLMRRMPFGSNTWRFDRFSASDIQLFRPMRFISSMCEPAKKGIIQHLIDGLEPLRLLSLSYIWLQLVPFNIGPESLGLSLVIWFIILIYGYEIRCVILRKCFIPAAFINTIFHKWSIMIMLTQTHFVLFLLEVSCIWLEIGPELVQSLVASQVDVLFCDLFSIELEYVLIMCIFPIEYTVMFCAFGFTRTHNAILKWQIRFL